MKLVYQIQAIDPKDSTIIEYSNIFVEQGEKFCKELDKFNNYYGDDCRIKVMSFKLI